jgi:4-hydroxy 2-oxovalerate aldolase
LYKNLKILDCTFRDGGYYTTWDFNQEVVLSYFKYAEELPIDYIEVGYRSTEKKSYLGEYFYLPKSTIKRILNHTTKKVVIMLNAKDFSSGESVRPLLEDLVQKVTMVRIAVNPFEISNYLALVEEIKDLGFEIGLNLMYISKLIKNIDCLNNVKKFDGLIDYLYLVDSYGGVYPSELRKIIQEVRSKTNIPLGFHGHNNMELAFSNTLTAIEEGVSLVDSTVLGMGRGAGN